MKAFDSQSSASASNFANRLPRFHDNSDNAFFQAKPKPEARSFLNPEPFFAGPQGHPTSQTVQAKAETVQRMGMEDEDVQMRAMASPIQRMDSQMDDEPIQGKFTLSGSQPQDQNSQQGNSTSTDRSPRENRTGMPDQLKSGLESMSGYDLSGVRVHYNSSKPAQLNAHAYTQGQTIEVGPGQEKHLPHEGWHVVQQMQGRVKPTTSVRNRVKINNDKALEREAEQMGERAIKFKGSALTPGKRPTQFSNSAPIQRVIIVKSDPESIHKDLEKYCTDHKKLKNATSGASSEEVYIAEATSALAEEVRDDYYLAEREEVVVKKVVVLRSMDNSKTEDIKGDLIPLEGLLPDKLNTNLALDKK